MPEADPLHQLSRSLDAVAALIDSVADDQWSGATPCTEWPVRRVVGHLVGMNLVFAAMLREQPPPQRGDDLPADQLASAFRDSSAALLAVFNQPEILDRSFTGPLGTATGSDRLHIRLYDLLAHGWDIAVQPANPTAYRKTPC